MARHSFTLYAIVVLIWGSTWFAIKFQLGVVAPELSVAYRFAMAGIILFIYALARGLPMRFAAKDHFFIALEGFLLFCLNYLMFYWVTEVLTTGLVAVIFSTFVFVNMLNASLFFRQPLRLDVLLGACLGLIGISMIFWPELSAFQTSSETIHAALLGLFATYIASLGNMAAVRNQKAGIPILQTHAFGMIYGALMLLVWAIYRGLPFVFDDSLAYTVSIVYLALFGTVIAFGCYMTLVSRIGVDRAAYATVLFPVVALLISTVYENYHWSLTSFIGVSLVLLGNLIVISKATLLRLRQRNLRDAKVY